jgi:FKBP-type peptidyl-prolyl cis-trans isomerase FkpA
MIRLMLAAALAFIVPMTAVTPLQAATAVPTMDELQNLIVRDTVVGTGKQAYMGRTIVVHYTGWLYDAKAPDLHGKQFDSSVGDDPFVFQLGAKKVIKGWDMGFAGMKVGGKRTLIIPGYLGYGQRGAGNGEIPPEAILVFDMELLDVK